MFFLFSCTTIASQPHCKPSSNCFQSLNTSIAQQQCHIHQCSTLSFVVATHTTPTFHTFFQFYIPVAYQTHTNTTHFAFLITLSSTRSNTHESQHTSRSWSPCRAPDQTHINHSTLREIDHLVEHHIKQTWITAHFAKLITLSSTISNTHESQHTSRNWSPCQAPDQTHHTSLNWSPCRAPYQTHMNHNNTLRVPDHLIEHQIKHTWITAHFA